MLTQPLIVARKEIRDHLRDTRSLVSSAFYAMMGPLVVGMVSLATRGEKSSAILLSMMSVFALVAAFVGGMNVAIDAISGERERRSLLPLLMNPLLRRDVVLGKWLAISFFAVAGLLVNLSGFAIVVALSREPIPRSGLLLLITVTLTLVPLALFAAALELWISTWCRNIKEAHTYLSLVIFLPMGVGMFLVFFPQMAPMWFWLPVAGQQLLIDLLAKGAHVSFFSAVALSLITSAAAAAILLAAAKLLQRDEFVYGG
jgi:sodium transport system permease protein